MGLEEQCVFCNGSGSNSVLGTSCMYCEGTGLEGFSYVQDSFEQQGPPQVAFGNVGNDVPTVHIDKDGVSFMDKDGNKIPFIKAVEANTSEEEQEPIIKLGYSGEVTIEVPVAKDEFASKGIFEDFMDGVKAAETGRTPIRFLMIQEVDELLDLYNDYKQLYDLFGDKEYLEYMNGIKKVLKAKTKK